MAVDDEVSVLLEHEREVGALRVAGGRGDGDASGLVRDKVAVLLEEDLDAVGEAEGGLVTGGDAEVGEFEFGYEEGGRESVSRMWNEESDEDDESQKTGTGIRRATIQLACGLPATRTKPVVCVRSRFSLLVLAVPSTYQNAEVCS